MWWMYIVVVVLLVGGIWAFAQLVNWRTWWFNQHTEREATTMYDNYTHPRPCLSG